MELPPSLRHHTPAIVTGPSAIRIESGFFLVTNHGRDRFEERTGRLGLTDEEIAMECLGDPRALWKEHDGVLHLVTYLLNPRRWNEYEDSYEDLHDEFADAGDTF